MNKVDKEEEIKNRILYLKNRGRLNKLNKKYISENKAKLIKKELNTVLEIENDELTYDFIKQIEEDLNNPEKKRELLLNIRDKYGINFIDDETEGELYNKGDFNEKDKE